MKEEITGKILNTALKEEFSVSNPDSTSDLGAIVKEELISEEPDIEQLTEKQNISCYSGHKEHVIQKELQQTSSNKNSVFKGEVTDHILNTTKEEITDKQSTLTDILSTAVKDEFSMSGSDAISDVGTIVKEELIMEESDNEQLAEKRNTICHSDHKEHVILTESQQSSSNKISIFKEEVIDILSVMKEEITEKQSTLTNILKTAVKDEFSMNGPDTISDVGAIVKEELILEDSDNEQLVEKTQSLDSQEIGEDQSIDSEAPPPLLPPQQRSERKRKHEPTPDEQLFVDNAIKIINDASRKPKNLYSGFGEHIANKLLTYDAYTWSQVEFKISKILYETVMQLLKPTQTHSLSTYTHSTHSNVTLPATTFVQDLDSPE